MTTTTTARAEAALVKAIRRAEKALAEYGPWIKGAGPKRPPLNS